METMGYSGPLYGKVGDKLVLMSMDTHEVDVIVNALEHLVAARAGDNCPAMQKARKALAKAKGAK